MPKKKKRKTNQRRKGYNGVMSFYGHSCRYLVEEDLMPVKIKRKFEKEYGKKKGDRIFYAWENEHNMLPSHKHLKHYHTHHHIKQWHKLRPVSVRKLFKD